MFLSDRSKFAQNPIEEEDKVALALEKKGRRIVKINRGDPTKYFPTPDYIIKAYVDALKLGKTAYSRADGEIFLKEAIVKRYRRLYKLKTDNDSVIVTAGLSEALMFLNSALVNDGENAILFNPYYPIYIQSLRMNGGEPKIEQYDEKDNWNVHIDRLKRSLKILNSEGKVGRIKYMLVANPNNPTGTVLRRNILKEVVDLANQYDIMLISDEIYDEIIYNGAKFTSISEIAKGTPYVILNGASKIFDATGFRIGFTIIPEEDKKSISLKEKLYYYALMRLSVNTPAQYAVAEALNNQSAHREAIRYMVSEIEKRTNHAVKLLSENQYLEVIRPNGAFYMFPRIKLDQLNIKHDKHFVDLLLREYGVQVTRGSGFGSPSHFRIVGLPPKEILDYAINKINIFCKKHSR